MPEKTRSGSPEEAAPPSGSSSWTFLTSHGLVLLAVARSPEATLRQIGDAVGLTERAAQKLVADLVDEGYLRRIQVGRRNRYEIRPKRRLRHRLSRETQIGELLSLIGLGASTTSRSG